MRGRINGNVALDVLSCGNSIGVISGESLQAGQHNNPFLSLLSLWRENETETFWMVFLQGFAMMDVQKGERDIAGMRKMHLQRLVLLLMWLAA